jgi:hypothetical protein
MTDVENIQAQFDDFRDTVTRVLTDLEQKAQNAGNDPQQLAALAQDISNAKAQVVAQDPAPPAPTPAPTGGTPDGTPAPATGVTPATTVPADQTGQTQVPDSQATPPDPQAA